MPGVRTYTTYTVECDDCNHVYEAARSDGWTAAKLVKNLRGHGWSVGQKTACCPPCASRRYGSARRPKSSRR